MAIKEDKIVEIYRTYNVRKKVIQGLIDISDSIPGEFQDLKNMVLNFAVQIYKKGIK